MRWLCVVAILGVGCGDKAGDDTGADGGSDGSGGDGSGGSAAGLCGDWSGIAGVGTTWEYSFSDASVSGSFVTTVSSLDSATGDLVMDSLYDGTTSSYSYTSSTTGNYRCDGDGMWMLDVSTTYKVTAGGSDSSGWTRITYDAPVLLFPRDAAVGDAWTVDATGTIESSTADPMTFSTTTTYEVASEETVSVPAGSFDTLRLDSSTEEVSGPPTTASSWIALDVGTVKTDTTELVSYDQP